MITIVWVLAGPPAMPEGCWTPWVSWCPWLWPSHLVTCLCKASGLPDGPVRQRPPLYPSGLRWPTGAGHVSSWCIEPPPTTTSNLGHV